MIRFLAIYSAFFKQQIKALIEYKVDFMTGMIALGAQQVSTFLVLFAVFTQIKAIGSYSFDEILLFYGYSQIIRGIDHIYNDNIWMIGWGKIKDGSFSQYLTRPIGIITHIVMERVQFDGFGELFIGVVIFLFAKIKLGLIFGIKGWVAFGVFIISGLAIYFAIKMLCASVAFWTVSSGELMTVAYDVNMFTKYPLDIYKNIILRSVLIYFVPFAAVSYFPMAYFLRDNKYISKVLGINYGNRDFLILFVAGIAFMAITVSLAVWNRGLRRYNASGS